MITIPEETIKEAAGGDMAAFEEIYKASRGYVFSVAYRITGTRHDAEEVTQDVFLKVYKKLGSFAFKSAFSTWLYRIAANTAINLYKKSSKERKRTCIFDEEIDPGNYGEEKENDFQEAERKQENEKLVRSMLGQLPEGQRACVVLKDIEGLKYEEIASALGINLNTVRSRLSRAREKLISVYGKGGQKP
jgi:RNA polymerase sigma-70 factor (ECF subfamily)